VYDYNARITRVIDGDTFDVEVDAGFRIWYRSPLRLFGVNAPELRTPEGPITRNAVLAWLGPLPATVRVHTHAPSALDKYGRYLAEVYKNDESLAAYLLANHLAVEYLL